MGTIVALVPVAAGLSSETGMNEAWLTAIVVGGAFFGDNLSFISDTTIAATRTQECDLRDKFRVNMRIVAPAAVVTLLVYLLTGSGADAVVAPGRVEWVRVLPYLLVLVTAIAGMNVLKVLLLGIAVGVGVMGLLSLVLSGRETPTHTEQADEVIYDSAQAAPAARWQDNVLMADPAQGRPSTKNTAVPCWAAI